MGGWNTRKWLDAWQGRPTTEYTEDLSPERKVAALTKCLWDVLWLIEIEGDVNNCLICGQDHYSEEYDDNPACPVYAARVLLRDSVGALDDPDHAIETKMDRQMISRIKRSGFDDLSY